MQKPILNFSGELSDLISALEKASHKMMPAERFDAVRGVVTASTARLERYSKLNPDFAEHPTFKLTESLVRHLSYLYEDAKAVDRAEYDSTMKSGNPSAHLKPVIEYLTFVERAGL